MQTKLSQKQIPTLLGLAILVISLIGGIWFIGEGAGVFAPRAAPQTTPKKVKVTNLKETSFAVSFVTDEATAGFVKYGTEPGSLKSQASDDRDQVTGAIGQYTNHHITVRDLKPDTTYYYILGTSSTPKYDNNGAPFTVKVPKRLGAPATAKTIYGTVTNSTGTPVGGALVYVSIPGVGPLSSVTKDSGSWAIPLSSARNTDGSAYASVAASDAIQLTAQGLLGNSGAFGSATIETAQPAPPLVLSDSGASSGENFENSTDANTVADTSAAGTSEVITTETQTLDPTLTQQEQVATQVPVDTTQQTTTETAIVPASDGKTIDLTQPTTQSVKTTQPIIEGTAPAKVMLQIEIHSDSQITTQLTTDSSGKYTIDLAALKQQLEPGEHTITISYVDPVTKKTVTETRTFTVESTATLALASATSSPQPFGTGNPFTLESPTPSPTASASAEPRVSNPSTASGDLESGSTETTFALALGGVFLLIAGAWSYLHNGQRKFV
jgi:hypothetical protein